MKKLRNIILSLVVLLAVSTTLFTVAGASKAQAATAEEVLNVARGQIGYTEGANNYNKYGEWYGKDFKNSPWCDMFISWCANKANAADIIGSYAYCPYHLNWFQQQKYGTGSVATVGALAFFRDGNKGVVSHVGIVESIDGKTLTTIEGNYDNKVARVKHNINDVYKFGYPKYTSSDSPEQATTVSLSALQLAAKMDPGRLQGETTPKAVKSVKIVEDALYQEGLLNKTYAYDGSYGTLTIKAYQKWQRSIGSAERYCDGIPGKQDLTKLGIKYEFSVG